MANPWRQRFLGWARPRAPEALPAHIDRHRVYVLPTPFGGFIGALLATMLLGALNYNNNPALLLGFLLAAAVHNSFVRAHLNLSGLRLLALQAEPVAAGTALHLHCLVQGDGRRDRPALLLDCDHIAAGAALHGADAQRVAVQWTPAHRGWQQPPRIRVQTRFPLGLAVAWCYFWPRAQVLVYPRAERNPPPLPSAVGLGSAQAQHGRGDELHHLRDYRNGDPLRDVAWKSSARAGQLLVREYEQPIANEMSLIWPATHGLAHEARISRLAAWVDMAEHQQRHYCLQLPQRQIAAGRGPAHRHACLRALAELGNA